MGLGKTYSTKYLLDSNNSSGVAGQVLSTTSTGIDWADANTLPGAGLWLANGNDIYNSNSGNVGIGTTNPGVKLEVASSSNPSIKIQGTTDGYAQKNSLIFDQKIVAGQTEVAKIYTELLNGATTSLNNPLKFATAQRSTLTMTDRMVIDNLGNVGIGTTDPDEKLVLYKAINYASDSAVYSAYAVNSTAVDNNTVFKWKTGITGNQLGHSLTFSTLARTQSSYVERMRIDSVGAVLIGGQPKIDTATKLQVGSNDSGVTSIWSNADDIVFEHNTNLGLTFATPNDAAATIAFADPQSVQAGWIQYLHDVDAMRFGTNGNNERMRITSAGGISFGSTGTAYGTSGQVLTSAGNASPTWTTPTTGTVTGTGAATQVAFWDTTSSLSGSNNLYWDSTNDHLGIGDATPGSRLKVTSGVNETSIYTVDINHVRNDANVATNAVRINMDLSGADTTTADRINSGLFLDIDSSANGDASNEHRIYGVNSAVNFTGFTDLARGGYFLAESNYTGGKTAQLVGVYGHAVHDANDAAGGVSNMIGSYGISSIQDTGDVDNALGVYGQVNIGDNRVADVGVTKGVEGEIIIDKSTALNYGTMIGISSIIDNNEGSVPNFGDQYLFKGAYQGTKGGNAYGIYSEGDKHYFEGNVGIGNTGPTSQLQVGPGTTNASRSLIASLGGTSNSMLSTLSLVNTAGNDTIGNGAAIDFHVASTYSPTARIAGIAETTSVETGLAFYTYTSGNLGERMRIDSAGNVGIGTTSPSATLVVSNGGAAGIELQPEQTTDTNRILNYDRATATYMDLRIDANAHQFMISGTERMRITSAGNVGIGVTNPNSYDSNADNLVIGSTGANDKNGITIVGGDTDGRGAVYFADTTQNSAGYISYFHSNNSMLFGTSDTTRMVIDSAGAIKFNAYDSTNNTGTPTYLLGTDASGNVVKTNSAPSPITSQAASLYDLIPNGAFTTTYAFTSTAGTYAEVMQGDDVITANGTYTVQMFVSDYAVGGTQYSETYSGIMSWGSSTNTNDNGGGAISEIVLHRSGHAANQGMTYLRTRETTSSEGNELRLEIMCNRTYTGASNIVFKFVRLI